MREIVFVIPQFKTGGGNRVFIELANNLVNGNSVAIIYPNNSSEINTYEVNEKIKVTSVGEIASGKIKKMLNVFKTIKYINKNYSASKVIISDPFMSIMTPFLSVGDIYRFVQADDYRIFDDGMILKNKLFLHTFKVLTKLSYKFNVKYLFNSQFTYNQFRNINRGYDGSAHIVHPAINNIIFNAIDLKRRSKDELQICLVARKHPMKGLSTFIEAWKALSLESKAKVYKVIIITHDDMNEFDLSEFEIVKPKCDLDIAKIYKESDIFVATSWWEGFGLPPLEAMACGCSVITSDAGGVNEFAIDKLNCLIFPPKNFQSLKQNLTELIEDKQKREVLSENGIKMSLNFSWKKSADQLLKIIE